MNTENVFARLSDKMETFLVITLKNDKTLENVVHRNSRFNKS